MDTCERTYKPVISFVLKSCHRHYNMSSCEYPVPTCVGFLDVDSLDEETVTRMLQHKPLAVANVLSLGFFHTDTHKFVSRPFAETFLLLMNRHFHLSTTSTCTGITL